MLKQQYIEGWFGIWKQELKMVGCWIVDDGSYVACSWNPMQRMWTLTAALKALQCRRVPDALEAGSADLFQCCIVSHIKWNTWLECRSVAVGKSLNERGLNALPFISSGGQSSVPSWIVAHVQRTSSHLCDLSLIGKSQKSTSISSRWWGG